MKKYLLVVFILLMWTGVDELYAQPSGKVTFDKTEFCEDEAVGGAIEPEIRIELTGTPPFDFDIYINYQSDPPSWDDWRKVRNYNSNVYTGTIPITKSEVITVKNLIDKDGNTGVFDVEETSITVDPMPAPSINDPIRTCDYDVYLSAVKEFESSTSLWRLENVGDGSLNDANSLSPIFTASANGTYNLYFTEVQGSCVAEISKSILVDYKASPGGSITGFTNDICSGQTSVLDLDLTGSFPISVSYTDGSIDFEEASDYQIETPALSSDAVYEIFKLVDVHGCETSVNEQANINVDFVPDVDAGTDIIDCTNEIELQAVLNSECFGEWIYEPAPHYLSDASSPTSLFTVPEHVQLSTENFVLIWKVTNENNVACYEEKSVNVTLNKIPESTILTDFDELYHAKEIDLNAEAVMDGMNGKWEVIQSPSTAPLIESPENKS
ncbi:MAG: hypothetical protein MI866_10975, partial [Bacteroidales bacterium]|nr:hypothetical protein [Bacteroidales bacterium]